MNAVDYLKEKYRMCHTHGSCKNCFLGKLESSNCGEDNVPEKAVEIVTKWAKDNPPKTYLSVLLEKFPKAKRYENGNPYACIVCFFGEEARPKECATMSCVGCWNREYKEE